MVSILSLLFIGLHRGAPTQSPAAPIRSTWGKEIVYQIFERSFFDSDGDRIGDFRGIERKLPYVKKLGATAILLQPIFKSRLYHNYFADSFTEADSSLGGTRQFFELVRAAHRKHIKVILDMEPQYVASDHPWFKAGPPRILKGSGFLGIEKLPTYSGAKVGIATVNLLDPQNVSDLHTIFKFWAAPGGIVDNGVDGFRIDHMMDDLDNGPVNINLLAGLWKPLEDDLRRFKPGIFFVAEQADWASLGEAQFRAASVDAVYAIPLRSAFLNALVLGAATPGLAKALIAERSATPKGKTQFTILEDHDVARYASVVNGDPSLLRLGSVFQLCLEGTPSIYYGQELGMRGKQLHGRDDGNDIPVRLAMPWSRNLQAKGLATWYGNGAWTQAAESKQNKNDSVEAEEKDSESLLNFYRRVIQIRKSRPSLTEGRQIVMATDDSAILAIDRKFSGQETLILLNFSPKSVSFHLQGLERKQGSDLLDLKRIQLSGLVTLSAHGFKLIAMDK